MFYIPGTCPDKLRLCCAVQRDNSESQSEEVKTGESQLETP